MTVRLSLRLSLAVVGALTLFGGVADACSLPVFRVALLDRAQPTIEIGGCNAPVPHLADGRDRRQQCIETKTGQPGDRDDDSGQNL